MSPLHLRYVAALPRKYLCTEDAITVITAWLENSVTGKLGSQLPMH